VWLGSNNRKLRKQKAHYPKNKTKQNKKNHLKSETLLVSNILDQGYSACHNNSKIYHLHRLPTVEEAQSLTVKNPCSPVVHSCNPSYSGGRDEEDHSSKPDWGNSS
jgi:hypothetical protein